MQSIWVIHSFSSCDGNLSPQLPVGDVTNVHAEQVPLAIGEGVKAALSAWTYRTLDG